MKARDVARGQPLAAPGQKPTCFYLVQSGLVAVTAPRGEKAIEVCLLTPPQSIGEELLFGPVFSGLTAIALRDSKIIEIPFDTTKKLITELGPEGGQIAKGLFERMKATFTELKNERVNREMTPCPGNHTAKVFGVIFHSARAVGNLEGTRQCDASWSQLKKYAEEVFDESIPRLEQAVDILIKLGYARMLTPSDSTLEPTLRLLEMSQIETFFDFYGTYHFKGGYAEFLKTNDKATRVTQALLEVAKSVPADRAGNVHIPYKAAIEGMKAILGSSFEADQLFRLEQKGLYMKRTATQDGGALSFYKPDFEQMLLTWKILRQVELWNQNGWVDMEGGSIAGVGIAASTQPSIEPEELARAEREKWARRLAGWKPFALRGKTIELRSGKPRLGEVWCQTCMSVITKNADACEVCGADIPGKKPN